MISLETLSTASLICQILITMPGLRIVVGGDDAGVDLKAALSKDISEHPRVNDTMDVGPFDASDKRPYPHFAIAAAEMVARGEADRACK